MYVDLDISKLSDHSGFYTYFNIELIYLKMFPFYFEFKQGLLPFKWYNSSETFCEVTREASYLYGFTLQNFGWIQTLEIANLAEEPTPNNE